MQGQHAVADEYHSNNFVLSEIKLFIIINKRQLARITLSHGIAFSDTRVINFKIFE